MMKQIRCPYCGSHDMTLYVWNNGEITLRQYWKDDELTTQIKQSGPDDLKGFCSKCGKYCKAEFKGDNTIRFFCNDSKLRLWIVVSGGNEEEFVVTFHRTHPEASKTFKTIIDEDLQFADKSKWVDDTGRTYQECLNQEEYIINNDGTYFEVFVMEGYL